MFHKLGQEGWVRESAKEINAPALTKKGNEAKLHSAHFLCLLKGRCLATFPLTRTCLTVRKNSLKEQTGWWSSLSGHNKNLPYLGTIEYVCYSFSILKAEAQGSQVQGQLWVDRNTLCQAKQNLKSLKYTPFPRLPCNLPHRSTRVLSQPRCLSVSLEKQTRFPQDSTSPCLVLSHVCTGRSSEEIHR